MGMLWDGRWETLPLREYFVLPYDKIVLSTVRSAHRGIFNSIVKGTDRRKPRKRYKI